MNPRIWGLVLIASLIAGCANPGVVQLSPDTYMISRTDKAGIFGNPSRLKAAVIREANEFAASQGKVAIPISTEETPLTVGRNFASFEYQFRVVDENDPEYGRVSLTPRPDVVIEDNKTLDFTIDDKRQDASDDDDLYQRLIQLDDLRERGILTDAEFEERKRKLLAQ